MCFGLLSTWIQYFGLLGKKTLQGGLKTVDVLQVFLPWALILLNTPSCYSTSMSHMHSPSKKAEGNYEKIMNKANWPRMIKLSWPINNRTVMTYTKAPTESGRTAFGLVKPIWLTGAVVSGFVMAKWPLISIRHPPPPTTNHVTQYGYDN